jgi:hypothetical protein
VTIAYLGTDWNDSVGVDDYISIIYKMDLDTGTILDQLNLAYEYKGVYCLEFYNGFMYGLTGICLIKVDLSTFTIVDTLSTTPYPGTWTLCIDNINGFLYAQNQWGNQIIKVDLSTFEQVTPNVNIYPYYHHFPMMIDSSNGYLYGSCETSVPDYASHIWKMKLSDLTVSFSPWLSNAGGYQSFGIDIDNQKIYYCASGVNPLHRINASDLSIEATLNLGLTFFPDDIIHIHNGHFYIFDGYSSNNILKFRISDFTLVDTLAVTLPSPFTDQSGFWASQLDSANNCIYFSTAYVYPWNSDTVGFIAKLDLATFTVSFIKEMKMSQGEYHIVCMLLAESISLPISSIYHKWHEPVVII